MPAEAALVASALLSAEGRAAALAVADVEPGTVVVRVFAAGDWEAETLGARLDAGVARLGAGTVAADLVDAQTGEALGSDQAWHPIEPHAVDGSIADGTRRTTRAWAVPCGHERATAARALEVAALARPGTAPVAAETVGAHAAQALLVGGAASAVGSAAGSETTADLARRATAEQHGAGRKREA